MNYRLNMINVLKPLSLSPTRLLAFPGEIFDFANQSVLVNGGQKCQFDRHQRQSIIARETGKSVGGPPTLVRGRAKVPKRIPDRSLQVHLNRSWSAASAVFRPVMLLRFRAQPRAAKTRLECSSTHWRRVMRIASISCQAQTFCKPDTYLGSRCELDRMKRKSDLPKDSVFRCGCRIKRAPKSLVVGEVNVTVLRRNKADIRWEVMPRQKCHHSQSTLALADRSKYREAIYIAPMHEPARKSATNQ